MHKNCSFTNNINFPNENSTKVNRKKIGIFFTASLIDLDNWIKFSAERFVFVFAFVSAVLNSRFVWSS